MKKMLAILLALMLVLGLTACGGSDDTSTDGDTTDAVEDTVDESEDTTEETPDTTDETEDTSDEMTEEVDFSVALVTDTGGIDDKSFNQGTWEGIQKFAEETGAEITYAQSNSDADYIPNLSTFSEEDYDLIVAPGFLFVESMSEVSNNFPEQNYLLIDDVVADRPNVANAVFAEEQGSFLVGVAAAQATLDAGKNSVGFIGGMDFALIQKFEAGFIAGVKEVAPDMEVVVEYVGDFVSTEVAASYASRMYDNGAYAIYHAAGGAGNGLLKEAKDRRASGEDVWAIGVDKDQYADGVYGDNGESAVLTSMVKRVDVASYNVAEMAMNGEFPGGETLVFTLENDGVGIPAENPNLSDEIVALVDEYAGKIKSGEITVPAVPED
ncbi:BMP family protein [Vallitaleaceae bacterium 9-2]